MVLNANPVIDSQRINRPDARPNRRRNWRRPAAIGAAAVALVAGGVKLLSQETEVPSKQVTYTVEPGDTLFGIVDKYVKEGVDLRPLVDEVSDKILPELGIESAGELRPGMQLSFEIPENVYDTQSEPEASP
ncbi:LysM peptidoglycan-binding domain-containing protein [Candidatus Microgenomates bacterium]|nr:LysM peptidoglycan-binding domain-containing protein [Candidatus Microgenomates bacterium]